MQSEVNDLVGKVLKLSPSARAYLAEVLLQSLDHEEDFQISDEWMKEIHHRCREIDEEKIQLVMAEDALVQLQKKYS